MDYNIGDVLQTRRVGNSPFAMGVYRVIKKHKNYRVMKLLYGAGQTYLTKPVEYIKEYFIFHIAETMKNRVERKQKDV